MTRQYPYSPSTFGDLADDGYEMMAYCGPCHRQVAIDLAALPRQESYLNRRFTCSSCGKPGQCVLTPASALEYNSGRNRHE